MRLFIAVDLSDGTRSRIASMGDELRRDMKRGSFAAKENLHLTLVFIGECNDMQANAAKAAMQEIRFEPFALTVDRIGRFRRYGDSHIWWAGVSGSEQLKNVRRSLAEGLALRGIRTDEREYSPHITFGREVVTKREPWPIEPFGETVYAIDLMRSERTDGKLTYTSIYRKGAE
jgi:2'-5' RNA ligase